MRRISQESSIISWGSSQISHGTSGKVSLLPSKLQVKTTVKSAVLQYWLAKLRSKSEHIKSLQYLKSEFLGLTRSHLLFLTCGVSPWEIEKATTQICLLSGRCRLESLSGHWVPWNKGGLCSMSGCWGSDAAHTGSVEDFLTACHSLSSTRSALALW